MLGRNTIIQKKTASTFETASAKHELTKGKYLIFNVWSHLGLNQGPPDYESDALTN